MSRWYDLEPVGEEFFSTAAHRFSFPIHLRAAADDVWAELTGVDPLRWVTRLRAEYTTEQPFGPGTRRSVVVGDGLLRMREEFFHWDDAERRHAFYADQTTIPAFRSFAEDFHVVDAPHGSTLHWSFAYEARTGLGLVAWAGRPVAKLIFTDFVRDTRGYFGAAEPAAGPARDAAA